ncbi:MAG TPA: ABC transporter ATP-binding protein [Gemmatimonadaceae bacterium]|nr:ABC transporter ATP-binding protein [Gemmatimonadaceae bacterium]
MIALEGVGKTYRSRFGGAVRAVDDVTLRVEAGEVVGLAGPNGAGKSTLLAMLLGFLPPTDGVVTLGGVPPRAYVETHGVGYLSELVAIPPRWRAGEALERYAILAGIPAGHRRARVETVVARLDLAPHRAKRIRALSKGTLQRLGLAQALLQDARVLILDEPTHGLDPVWTAHFRELVAELRAPDRALVVASHNLDELERVADRVAIMNDGRVRRVVDLRGPTGFTGGRYRLRVVAGADQVAAAFPAAAAVAPGEYEVEVGNAEALNVALAALLARGGRVTSVAPARSSLEEHFRQAIAGDAA